MFKLPRCKNVHKYFPRFILTTGRQLIIVILRILALLQEIWKHKIAQNARNTTKCMKHSKYCTFYNTRQVKQSSTKVLRFQLYPRRCEFA